jgi:hypothetical protein
MNGAPQKFVSLPLFKPTTKKRLTTMKSPHFSYRLSIIAVHFIVSLLGIVLALVAVFLYQQIYLSHAIKQAAFIEFVKAWFDWIVVAPTIIYLSIVNLLSRKKSFGKWITLLVIAITYGYIGGLLVQENIGPFCYIDCFSGIYLPYSFMYSSGIIFGLVVTIVYISFFMHGRSAL